MLRRNQLRIAVICRISCIFVFCGPLPEPSVFRRKTQHQSMPDNCLSRICKIFPTASFLMPDECPSPHAPVVHRIRMRGSGPCERGSIPRRGISICTPGEPVRAVPAARPAAWPLQEIEPGEDPQPCPGIRIGHLLPCACQLMERRAQRLIVAIIHAVHHFCFL